MGQESPSQQNAIKAQEKVATGGQHERHGLSWLETARLQPCGDRLGAGMQSRIGDLLDALVLHVQSNVPALRVYACVPIKHLDQGCGSNGYPIGSFAHASLDCRGNAQRCPYASLVYAATRSRSTSAVVAALFGQLHPKSTFEAEQEFHPPQAIEAKIAFQRTVECDGQGVVLMRMKLDGELLHNCESSIWVIASGIRCCACGSLDTVSSIRVSEDRGGRAEPALPITGILYCSPFLYQAYRLWWILQLGGVTCEDLRR